MEQAREKRLAIGILVACLLCVILCCNTTCFAEKPENTVEPGYVFMNDAKSIDVHSVQIRLQELGYLEQSGYEVTLEMRYALKQFCENNNLPFEDKGVTVEIWNKLLYSTEVVGVLERERDASIYFGEESQRVTNVQIRLKELGYYEGEPLSVSVYDETMQTAVERFCENNKILYDGKDLNPSIQEMIFSDAAAPYEQVVENIWNRIRIFLHGNTVLQGRSFPNFALYGALYLVLYLLVVGVIFLVFRKGIREEAPVVKDGKCGISVTFVIHYNGNRQEKRLRIGEGESIEIGRSSNVLKTDDKDMKISRRHCIISCKMGELILEDVSRHGTNLNMQPLNRKKEKLRNGDRLILGAHVIDLKF